MNAEHQGAVWSLEMLAEDNAKISRYVSVFIIFLLGCTIVRAAEDTASWTNEFQSALSIIEKRGLSRPAKGEELTGRFWGARFRAPSSLASIGELWLADEAAYVELTWWRQRDRAARTFALAVFYTQYGSKMETGAAPQFEEHIKQFREDARKERQEELKYVLGNLSDLKKRIDRLFASAKESPP